MNIFVKSFLVFGVCLMSACSDSNEKSRSESSNGQLAIDAQQVISRMEKHDIEFEAHSRYFSLYTYGKTKNFISFKKQHIVYEVTFHSEASVSATINQFASKDKEKISLWVNNQHSDGLYGDAPIPTTLEIDSSHVSILERAKAGEESGENGDAYDVYVVKYHIAPQILDSALELPAVIFSTKVYIRTKDISCAPVCEQ
ncbi:MAG: hypothetical protein K6L76_06490 [Agarilytica sp.]